MKRILIAPLDWGLGHATRCIPIIEELIHRKCEVIVASSGSALTLLKKEFPELKFVALPPYRIKYPRSGSFVFAIVKQLPRILGVIAREHRRIKKVAREHKIDLIISDNRFGCWYGKVPSIFISHQLNIQLHSGWRMFKPIVDFFHYRAIKKFNQCWVPDDPKLNLTSELSRTKRLNVIPVGILSRFKAGESVNKYDLAIVLSGPEPQRSIFEEIVFKQIRNFQHPVIVVRGVIESEGNWKQEGHVTTVNFLSSARLEEIMNQSQLVIARSGYSTIMDLVRLGKKAVFVPTPGQTEQEYLGKKMMTDKVALCVDQRKFDLKSALQLSSGYSGFVKYPEGNLLREALDHVKV